jgi:hypothetical protein
MESEGSLKCSQETAIGPYPEPHESRPHSPIIMSRVCVTIDGVNSNIIADFHFPNHYTPSLLQPAVSSIVVAW